MYPTCKGVDSCNNSLINLHEIRIHNPVFRDFFETPVLVTCDEVSNRLYRSVGDLAHELDADACFGGIGGSC